MAGSDITADKARMLSQRWETKDRQVIDSFCSFEREKEALEDMVEEPLTSTAISLLVELRERIAYAKTLPQEYGSAPAKGKDSGIGKFIDERYDRIYNRIIEAQVDVKEAEDTLTNIVQSYVSAFKESYRRGKQQLKRAIDTRSRDDANAKMDKSALMFKQLSDALGFYSTSSSSQANSSQTNYVDFSSMRCWFLNRRAKKAIKRGTHVYSIIHTLDPNFVSAEEKWNQNKPMTTIFYKGRYVPFDASDSGARRNIRMVDVDVRLFVTPNDGYIQQDLAAENLMVKDPRNCNNDIMRIYRFTRESFRYESDETIAGKPEFWLFPFELRHTQRGDCDDWANHLASYLIGAGVPEFRVRVVCGKINGIDGEDAGHSTVYVLSDNLMTWYHLNSTTPMRDIPAVDLVSMPTSKDRSDFMGIGEVWFSYNNRYAWHAFEGTARSSYMQDRRSKMLSELM